MSRDCGWRSRRRAGSGCSPTSPRAGGMTTGGSAVGRDGAALQLLPATGAPAVPRGQAGHAGPRAADPTHRGDKQHRVSPGRGHEPAQALPGAGAGQGLPGPALPAGAESHQWPGCSTCTASWSPSSTRCLRRRSTWSWTPAKWKLRMCSGLHRPQTEAEVLEQSAQTLRAHLGALLSALSRSVHACPAVVRATFRQLFRRVRERFPGAQHENVPFIAVTSFLCLRFFRHRVVQALPPAGAPRGRPHQPHPAPVGQGSPERGQHGHAGFQGQGGLDGAAAAHRAPGRGAAEGLHHQARGHRGEGRAGPAADAEFAGATCEGGATLHPQDQGQGPPHVLLLQEALLLPHYRGPQLREDAQLQGQPQCGRPCAPSGVRSTKCTCRPPSTLWLSTSWMRMPSAGTLSERSALQGTP
ncbi:uncharacterized protein LOC117978414 isoform X2 [Pan paniscus]|uniref:uncharacterized protein LOC117978414 isoform X2 n=1 Tax=Pan paniscus TaxID=9597 RepID=UPI003004944F